jgi:excinuclease ABC subunit A
LEIDENKVIPNPKLSLSEGALSPFEMPSANQDRKELMGFCKKAKINLNTAWCDLPQEHRDLVWKGSKDFYGVKGLFDYLETKKYKMHVRVFISRFRSPSKCPDCKGARLRRESEDVLIQSKSFQDLSSMSIRELKVFFDDFVPSKTELEISQEVLKQLRSRLEFLVRVGVHYLGVDRETRSLSGGEFQRIMLANQLGMGLSQTLFVLDEPTVGLHPRDNERLISILKDLKQLGNTLVVVEHDHDVIASSEHIVEMGPGSGQFGGNIIFAGGKEDFYKSERSRTASYLKRKKVSLAKLRSVEKEHLKYKLSLKGAKGNNLRDIDLDIPLNRVVSVTGVSGSGKSTAITRTLYPALARALNIDYLPAEEYAELLGAEHLQSVVLIDQSPIGKTARSSPVTYLKIFDGIRTLFASTLEAKERAYTPGTFSLNVDGGRCPACKGTGFEEIDMQFMDNVIIPCDVCDAKKYQAKVLEVKFKDKSIDDVLNMTVAEAMNFFVAHPNIRKPLSLLKEVGLDYLKLGQPANSLSGGESQRLKVARELSAVTHKSTLYILDEPTTGLHFAEIELLLSVLNKLVESGGSVLLVEHNLDVILASDYIIDLGPEAGEDGGQIVAQGSPREIMKSKKSLTGEYLRKYCGERP